MLYASQAEGQSLHETYVKGDQEVEAGEAPKQRASTKESFWVL